MFVGAPKMWGPGAAAPIAPMVIRRWLKVIDIIDGRISLTLSLDQQKLKGLTIIFCSFENNFSKVLIKSLDVFHY